MKDINPRMHSAEHILNQAMIRLFGCDRCFNAHIEEKKSKCDYHFQRELTQEDVSIIEKEVNNIIAQDLPITFFFLAKEEAMQKYNMQKVPEDVGDPVRIVAIGDYDFCPCIGAHVISSKKIGTFKIISHNFQNEILRIRFRV